MMWWRIVFFIVTFIFPLTLGEKTEVFDVTTVFESGKFYGVARIYIDSNALGLPLYGKTDLVETETLGSLNATYCDSFENICGWEARGWTSEYEFEKVAPKQLYRCNMGFRVNLTEPDSIWEPENHYLYFTPGRDISSGPFHVVILNKDKYTSVRNGTIRIRVNLRTNCQINDLGIYYGNEINLLKADGTIMNVRCETVQTFYHYYERGDFFSFTCDDYIKIYKGLSLEETVTNKIDIKYFQTVSNHPFSLSIQTKGPIYSSESMDSEMISPKITLKSLDVCLRIIFRSSINSTVPLFDIILEEYSGKRLNLKQINNAKVGWNYEQVELTAPPNITGPMSLVIKKITSDKISILRISSCNPSFGPYGVEVKLLKTPISLYKTTKPFSSSILTATAYDIVPVNEEIHSNTTKCFNGGVLTSAGCACPPGYFGLFDSQCQIGCGENRFGQLCRSTCSPGKSGCEGLVLCTNPTGCHCAPGYRGDRCKTKCSPGWHGNDCLQRCGHCLSPCGIYTGQCVCEPGYIAPLCMLKSA